MLVYFCFVMIVIHHIYKCQRLFPKYGPLT